MKEREEEGGMKRVRREGEREKRGNKKKKKEKHSPSLTISKNVLLKKKKNYTFLVNCTVIEFLEFAHLVIV